MTTGPVLVMAGGTGGHVFPAMAVARELEAKGRKVVWLGTRQGLEADVVPRAGFAMEWIQVSGLRGKGVMRLVMAPFMLLHALWQAMQVLRRVQPAVVLGMGGFVTGPGGLMAWLLRKPLLVHEQNSVAGLTNRLLRPLARKVMVAFPGALAGAVHTGNPVRADIAALPEPAGRKVGEHQPLRLLVLGGSLGAQALNETVPAALARLPEEQRPEVRHQTGKRNLDGGRAAYEEAAVRADVQPFLEDMAEAYGWADLVICRAGALTIAELAAAGVGSVLVPFPYAVDDHQTGNARYLADQGAAVLIQQTELSADRLSSLLADYTARPEKLVEMACKARELARPDALHQVVDLCLAYADRSVAP